jgi:hypothetical protein
MRKALWIGLAVAAIAAAGCGKKKEEAPAQPAPPPAADATAAPASSMREPARTEPAPAPAAGDQTAPAPSADVDRAAMEKLDGVAERLVGGLAMGMGRRAAAGTPPRPAGPTVPGPGEEEDEEDAPPPFSRIQMDVDVAALQSTPLWTFVETSLRVAYSQSEGTMACVLDLMRNYRSAYADMEISPAGEMTGLLVVANIDLPADRLVGCFRAVMGGQGSLVDVRIGGKTGYAMEGIPMPKPMAIVELTPGKWLVGYRTSIEAAVAAGGDPAADPGFQALAAPLGPSSMRVALALGPGYAALASAAGDLPAEVQCVGPVLARVRGLAVGLRYAADLGVTLAVQNASPAAAAETQQCLSMVWGIAKTAMLAELDPEDAAEAQAVLGMPLPALLDAVQVQADGAFAKVTATVPARVLTTVIDAATRELRSGTEPPAPARPAPPAPVAAPPPP